MGGVDLRYHHRVVGVSFSNVAHFKKWRKKVFLGICDFSFPQKITAWNLSVDEIDRTRRGGIQQQKKYLNGNFILWRMKK